MASKSGGASNAERKLFKRFARDNSGNYAIITALAMPVLVGVAAFGTEEGLLLHNQKSMQHAADSAAATAAVAVTAGANDQGKLQARSVAASYGFVDGAPDHTRVIVNSPPTGGRYTNNASAIEVRIVQPQAKLFSSLWGSGTHTVAARSVATPTGQPCILALNPALSGSYSEQGSVTTNLIDCAVIVDSSSSSALNVGGSSRLSTSFAAVVGGISGLSGITATYGAQTHYHYVPDPYADRSYPSFSGCDKHNYQTSKDDTLSPGVYCGGMKLTSSAHVTLRSGIYYLDGGSLDMSGQSGLSGTGVTLVFTSSGSNYATASITGGASINLVAPSTGPTAGIAIFGDRSMPVGTTFKFAGGDSQAVGGAVYISKGAIQWAGNATANQPCTQIVADTVSMVGTSGLKVNCAGYGTVAITTPAMLLE